MGDPAARSVFLRGMGDGRDAVVAAERGRHQVPFARSALPRRGANLLERSGPRARAAADHARRPHPDGAGGK